MRLASCVIVVAACSSETSTPYDLAPIDGVAAATVVARAGSLVAAVADGDALAAAQITVELETETGDVSGDARALSVGSVDASHCTVTRCSFSGRVSSASGEYPYEGSVTVDGSEVIAATRFTVEPAAAAQFIARFSIRDAVGGSTVWDDTSRDSHERITYEAVVLDADCATSGVVTATYAYKRERRRIGTLDFANEPACATP